MNFSPASAPALTENTRIHEGNARPSRARAYKGKAQSHSTETSESDAVVHLVEAFDALTALEHAHCAWDASHLVLGMLDDLIPSRASAIALYDINAHVLRVVATQGIGKETRHKAEVTLLQDSRMARAAASTRPLLFVGAEAHFNAAMDAPEGLIPSQMLLIPVTHEGRLRGVIQLIDRRTADTFSEADQRLLTYVAERFAAFFAR